MSLLQLANVEYSQLKKLIDYIYSLDEILKVVTLKQIFNIEHTPPALPTNFTLDLPLPGFDSGTSGGGDPDDFLFERSGREIKVTYKRTSEYVVSWVRLEKNNRYCDELASKEEKQKCFLYRWAMLDASNKGLHPFILLTKPHPMRLVKINVTDQGLDQDEIEENDKIEKVYYSTDTKQFVYEKYDKEFPIDALMSEHLWALFRVPYYFEKCKNQTLEENGYSYKKLRSISGMSERKLAILISEITFMLNLIELIPLEQLVHIDDDRLHNIIKYFDKRIKLALEFVDIREIAGLNDKSKLAPQKSSGMTKSSHTIFSLKIRLQNIEKRYQVLEEVNQKIDEEVIRMHDELENISFALKRK